MLDLKAKGREGDETKKTNISSMKQRNYTLIADFPPLELTLALAMTLRFSMHSFVDESARLIGKARRLAGSSGKR